MFMVRKPTREWIDAVLRVQRRLPFSYREAGATRNETVPLGYRSAMYRVCLGEGAEVFARAKEAIRAWTMFPAPLTEICWPYAAIEQGSTVGVLCRTFGLWTLNVCRIIYVVDESDRPLERFGFAYGTLPRHFERGEERFLVEWDQRDNRVWYEVRMFCQPTHWMAWLTDPLVRRLQRKFGRLTKQAMIKAVSMGRETTAAPVV